MKINKIIYVFFLILIIFFISKKFEGYQNMNEKYKKILKNTDKNSKKIYDKNYNRDKSQLPNINNLNKKINLCNRDCLKNILKLNKRINIKNFRKLRTYCDNKCFKNFIRDDKRIDNNYIDNKYRDNKYRDNEYRHDKLRDNEYRDNEYRDNEYRDNEYRDNEYRDNEYRDDTYIDNGYRRNGLRDNEYRDNGYRDDKLRNNKYIDNKYISNKQKKLYNKKGSGASNKYCNDSQVGCYSQNESNNNGICGTCINGYLFGCPNKCKNINCKKSTRICN